MWSRGRWTIAAIGGVALLAASVVGVSRARRARANAARFAWALEGNTLSADSAGRDWIGASDGANAFVARVSRRGLEARQPLAPLAATWAHVSALTSLDAERVAYGAVARTGTGFQAWVGVSGRDATGARELGPADALVVDAAGVLTGIVPCHAPSAVASAREWVNDASRCLVTVPARGELGALRPLCDECSMNAARTSGDTLRAWITREQRRNVLIALDTRGPVRDLAAIDFETGPGFVHAVSFAPDGGSVVVGELSGVLVTGERRVRNEAGSDAFVVAFEPSGRVRFARVFGSVAAESAVGVWILPDGAIRVLVDVRSDVEPRWHERLLGGRAASPTTLDVLELDAAGELRSRRRYAVVDPDASPRLAPRLVGADDAHAFVALAPSMAAPLLDSQPSNRGYLVLGLAAR